MAKATAKPVATVAVVVSFEVTEEEARALDALAGYGDDAAVEAFYKHCGSCYMKPYEQGFRSFLKSIRGVVSPALNEADAMRRTLAEAKKQ